MGDVEVPDVKQLDITIHESALVEGTLGLIKQLRPQWQDVQTKIFTEGITNKLVGCYERGKFEEEVVLVRIYGLKTELFIDRDVEKENIAALSKQGLSAPLFAVFNNGIAYGFVYGSTLDEKTVRDPTIQRLIAKEMCRLHTSKNLEEKHEPGLYSKMTNFLELCPDSFNDPDLQKRFVAEVKSKSELLEEFELLKSHTEKLNCPVVFSHNDLLLKNIIYNKKTESVSFIDLEYAMFNYQPFDIADHFCEYAGVDTVDYSLYPEHEYQLSWLRNYLESWNEMTNCKETVTDLAVERLYVQVNKFALLAHFFWGIWALIQAKNSTVDFDFLGYGIERLNEYFARKNDFLALEMP
ncbi:hypothetical protein ScPMuIL_016518 [Solemya velum]